MAPQDVPPAPEEADVTSYSGLDIADTGVEEGSSSNSEGNQTAAVSESPDPVMDLLRKTSLLLPPRPHIRRNESGPPPPEQQPPLPPPGQDQDAGTAADSLSLAQLKRLVHEGRPEARAYDFTYHDAGSFEDEIEEWFSYADEEKAVLLSLKVAFEKRWLEFKKDNHARWAGADQETRKEFLKREIGGLQRPSTWERRNSLRALLYIAQGAWGETHDGEQSKWEKANDELKGERKKLQLDRMMEYILLIIDCDGLPPIYHLFQQACLREENGPGNHSAGNSDSCALLEAQDLSNLFTFLYLVVEAGRRQRGSDGETSIRDRLVLLQPNLLQSLIKVIARLRWEDADNLPTTRTLLLFWKSILLLFGGSRELRETKDALRERTGQAGDDDDGALITASPLDYHMFRQEITSKYPAYNPRPPILPLEPDHSSILPPLPHQTGGKGNRSRMGTGPTNMQGTSSSILNQPVHIATPAPSPPPSPGGPGKAGKKQNYQTNQNFPFLYPPVEAPPPFAREDPRWEGTDVPASIREAGELFACRVRMTRALRQLWEERERYMQFERGWAGVAEEGKIKVIEDHDSAASPDVKRRLDVVEQFYMHALPNLQSCVIVLLKVILLNLTTVLSNPTQANGVNGNAENGDGPHKEEGGTDDDNAKVKPVLTPEQLEAERTREIEFKAVSGVLLLLLKWFKLSHILKFEYLAQLVLDSNYLPLMLKFFTHQDVDKSVASYIDRSELGFFARCEAFAKGPPGEDDDGDDACPPPIIRRHREQVVPPPVLLQPPADSTDAPSKSLVDELGCAIPLSPITVFSWRNFFSTINFLRIMQKICKRKAHRNLLLVQYKSSNILRKALKVPQRELRLYTLKLFKNQVPYCGRKWRQTNMRVITAVYLYCRPELRDDWLTGSDVDADVEEALPLEQALRALTHWYNLQRYPDQMGGEARLLDEEQDFFLRELERMEIAVDDNGDRSESMWDGSLPMEGGNPW
ncbi:MAG: mitochondrial Homoaconitase [Watsoniomyces obsoletus]|nr:MAG: mitochondrial Homoaconitase [Watsoniomyces obsoletus]